jgi:hypothetical protein
MGWVAYSESGLMYMGAPELAAELLAVRRHRVFGPRQLAARGDAARAGQRSSSAPQHCLIIGVYELADSTCLLAGCRATSLQFNCDLDRDGTRPLPFP